MLGKSGKKVTGVTVHYGTILLPSTSKGILPSHYDYDSTSSWRRPEISKKRRTENVVGFKLPSISLILGVTRDNTALFHWQRGMIERLSRGGFLRWMRDRAAVGTAFHSSVGQLLQARFEDYVNYDSIEKDVLDEALMKRPEAVGYVKSVLGLLRSGLPVLPSVLTEKPVLHPDLRYQGRFDALLCSSLSDLPSSEGILVEWKTAPAGSRLDGSFPSLSPREQLSALYEYPVQVAAYAAACNSDPLMPRINRALLVIARENGEDAFCVDMDEELIQEYWKVWLENVNAFWKCLNEHNDRGEAVVDCRYQPPHS